MQGYICNANNISMYTYMIIYDYNIHIYCMEDHLVYPEIINSILIYIKYDDTIICICVYPANSKSSIRAA